MMSAEGCALRFGMTSNDQYLPPEPKKMKTEAMNHIHQYLEIKKERQDEEFKPSQSFEMEWSSQQPQTYDPAIRTVQNNCSPNYGASSFYNCIDDKREENIQQPPPRISVGHSDNHHHQLPQFNNYNFAYPSHSNQSKQHIDRQAITNYAVDKSLSHLGAFPSYLQDDFHSKFRNVDLTSTLRDESRLFQSQNLKQGSYDSYTQHHAFTEFSNLGMKSISACHHHNASYSSNLVSSPSKSIPEFDYLTNSQFTFKSELPGITHHNFLDEITCTTNDSGSDLVTSISPYIENAYKTDGQQQDILNPTEEISLKDENDSLTSMQPSHNKGNESSNVKHNKKLSDYIEEYEHLGLCKVIEGYVETMKDRTALANPENNHTNLDTTGLKQWPLYAHITTIDKFIPLNGVKCNHWSTIDDFQDISCQCDDWLSNQVEIQEMKDELLKTLEDMSPQDSNLILDEENFVDMFKIFIGRRTRFFFNNKFYRNIAEEDKTRLLCRAVAAGVFIVSCAQIDVDTYSWPNKNSTSLYKSYCIRGTSRNFRHIFTTEQYIRFMNFCTKYNKIYCDDSIIVLMQILALFKETSGLSNPLPVKQGWCHYISTLKSYVTFTYGKDKAKDLLTSLIQSIDDAFFLSYTTQDVSVITAPEKPDFIREPNFIQDIKNISNAAYDTLITVVLNNLETLNNFSKNSRQNNIITNNDMSEHNKSKYSYYLKSNDVDSTMGVVVPTCACEDILDMSLVKPTTISLTPAKVIKLNKEKLTNAILILKRLKNTSGTDMKDYLRSTLSSETLYKIANCLSTSDVEIS